MTWGYFCLQELHCLQNFNMTMHYPQWNYITVQSFVFTSATVSEEAEEEEEQQQQREDEQLVKGTF